ALFDARVGATESTYWFFPLMRYSEDQVATSTFVAPVYYRSKHDGSNTRWSVIPLVYNRVAHYQDGTDAYLNFSPLHYYNTDSDRSLLITPLAYYHRDLESDTLFFPGYYAHNNGREQSRLYGNVWSRTAHDSTNKSLHVLPLYLSWHADTYDEYFISGLYLYKNQNRSHQNFLMLADHEYDRERERRSVSLALGALHYDSRPGSVSTGIGILDQPVLAGLDVAADGYDFNLLWHKQVSDTHSYHNSFFPLWWVDVSSDETFWVAAPLLSYSEVYGNSGTHLWGAGAIYYSSYDLDYGERSTHMLMGLLYQDIQKPERGYRTRGSLWRILWEYQEESDTGFQKFSILKFVYSRTKTEEEIHHRVLGVKIS
ncbi:MAG: hypothetical protein KDK27_09555, partial [Leptospiraceae bacterium]|nr:hypothetical protein [Leptospiraceae bacterium]